MDVTEGALVLPGPAVGFALTDVVADEVCELEVVLVFLGSTVVAADSASCDVLAGGAV